MKESLSMRMLSLFALLVVLSLVAGACRDMGVNPEGPVPSPPPIVTADSVSFRNNVLPILTRYGCTSCHGGTAGLTVGTVAGLEAGGLHGPAIVPGNADASNIVLKISPNPPFGERMPQGGPFMDLATIRIIRDWINQGAKDN